MHEFKSTSGAKVKINPADFEDAMDLQSAIMKEVSKTDFKMDGIDMNNESSFGGLIKVAMSVASSKDVRDIIFKCLVRCTYEGQKITPKTFEDVDARRDYYEIVIACLKENLSPFFEGLLSKLSPLMSGLKQAEESPKLQ